MIEYTLLNVLILELKIWCGPDKFYGRSKFGQYDELKNRAPLCFSDQLEKQDGRHGLLLAETFLTSPLKPLNGKSMELDRKQDLNILY